jgi:hypothetical protein
MPSRWPSTPSPWPWPASGTCRPGSPPGRGGPRRDQPLRPEGDHPRWRRHHLVAARAAGPVPGGGHRGPARPDPVRVRPAPCQVGAAHDVLPARWWWYLALALTPETRGIIGAPELELMDESAWLVNVARGRMSTPTRWCPRSRPGRSPALRSTSPTPSRCPTATRCGICPTASSPRTPPTPSRWSCPCWPSGSAPTWPCSPPARPWSDWSTRRRLLSQRQSPRQSQR